MRHSFKTELKIRANTWLYLPLLLLVIPMPWLVAWLLAASFHELCHWLAVKFFDGEVYQLNIGITGAEMICSVLSPWKSVIAILSGPVGGLTLALLGRWIPRIALCSWILSVYNLLPLIPLDGGRALEILLQGNRMFHIVERIFLILMALCAFYATFYLHLGVLPVAILCVLWFRNGKIPCKPAACGVK